MAAITTTKILQFKQHSSTKKLDPFFSNTHFVIPKLPKPLPTTLQTTTYKKFITKAITTAKKGNNLLFMVTHSKHSHTLFPLMVDLSRTYTNIEFVFVMGDESDKTKALCERKSIKRAPHYSFYRSIEKVHDEEGIISMDDFTRVVSYYGDNHSAVIQLHSKKDVENLIEEHISDNKLIVLNAGLKHCGPCMKVYPTFLMLSKQMVDDVVFAKIDRDENDNCKDFLEDMEVVEVPTFLFIRDGVIRGRYVGSGKVKLMGEILRYQRYQS
ncbi:hypothetical protein MKX03_022795 [Papaver bracteatum]|nr:hypothetical protein MKX03_022795 [Papaver bracteatum]